MPPVRYILDSNWFFRLKEYFFSVYENTLFDLMIFCILIVIIFFGRNIYMKYAIRKARNNLPLVIGGWGTRGKSSVERLKVAIINALGYSLLSKTTGCEAMFIHGHPFSPMREMFLFRPYDKATIWEQHHLTRFAHKMNCDVVLWECMGLTPPYVKILQKEWMKDDLSTITNTYPDHEDIQGPAGINLPEVMTNFIPENSKLITTEEQMLPILNYAAERFNSQFEGLDWLDAGLITDDILNRFSYEEHPYNIALVLSLARELGVEKDFALKEMADRVIPDIGVLKIYPPAKVETKVLEFVSGMSANERFGALSNWTRVEFDGHRLDKDPDKWIMTVVNNRADRIPRSKVFARMLVEDLSADRHILIGSNLNGLVGYIKEAWDSFFKGLTFFHGNGANPGSKTEGLFTKLAEKLRVPINPDQVKGRLKAMLENHPLFLETPDPVKHMLALFDQPDQLELKLEDLKINNAKEIIAFLKTDLEQYNEYSAILNKLESADPGRESALDAEAKNILEKWFQKKFIVVWDFNATGNQVVGQVIKHTPPGLYNRIMMLQNIKGTGLEFVYTWQAWERCYNACTKLLSAEPSEAGDGLKTLSSFREFGLLTRETVNETIDQVRKLPVWQSERLQADFNMILSNQKKVLSQLSPKAGDGNQSGWGHRVLAWIEAFQDAGDAVKRTKKAAKIYNDLVTQRISHERAAHELKALYKRQKGGWLAGQLQNFTFFRSSAKSS